MDTENKTRCKRCIGIIINGRKVDHTFILDGIKDILKRFNFEFVLVDYDITNATNMERALLELALCKILISVGGDGTLLSALKVAIKYNIAVLPIYLGTLGFISELPASEAFVILENYLENKNDLFDIESRVLLSVSIIEQLKDTIDIQNFFAVNELVVSKPAGRPISLSIAIAGKKISNLVGDGVVVATPTGSTAYALSAGGPIISPLLDAISFVPIAPHSLTFRPLVIPRGHSITIELHKESVSTAVVAIDGDDISSLKIGDLVSIKMREECCFIFQGKNRTFYDILRDKLNWGL